MAYWTSAASQVRSLAKAVSAAFAASALTLEEKHPNKIEIADLPWQAPPLISDDMLEGAPLSGYLDSPIAVEPLALFNFWIDTLELMWTEPSRLLRRGALSTCGKAMPLVKVGQRALRFARPAGYPGMIDDLAGAMFSLEVAHTAMISLPITNIVSDENNYYVEAEGRIYGVRDGTPACGGPWMASLEGMVQEMLRMPRGGTDYECHYDQIASLRSVLHVNRSRFPRNFAAMDGALQALRLLTMGGHCPELVHEMHVAPYDLAEVKVHERNLRDAIEVMSAQMSDRSKLQTLEGLLVPTTLSPSKFRQHIYAGAQYPFTLVVGRVEAIEAWLRREYERRVPSEVRQLKEKK